MAGIMNGSSCWVFNQLKKVTLEMSPNVFLIHNYQSTSSYLWVAVITTDLPKEARGQSEESIITARGWLLS